MMIKKKQEVKSSIYQLQIDSQPNPPTPIPMKSPIKTSHPNPNPLPSQTHSINQLHALYSMLPKQYTLYPTQQLKKNKHFFKPQQFIWNNPHRTSHKLYKYYHQQLHQYQKYHQPQIILLQQHDRQQRFTNRIRNLSQKRQQTRYRFHSKQLERLNLQNRSGIFRDSATYCQTQMPSLPTKPSIIPQSQQACSILRRSNSQSLRVTSNKSSKFKFLYRNIKTLKQEQVSTNEMSYLQSIQNFDSKNKAFSKTIKNSEKQVKNQIRQTFMKQKENNHQLHNSLYGIGQSKLVKGTFTKKKTLKFDFSNIARKCPNKSSARRS